MGIYALCFYDKKRVKFNEYKSMFFHRNIRGVYALLKGLSVNGELRFISKHLIFNCILCRMALKKQPMVAESSKRSWLLPLFLFDILC